MPWVVRGDFNEILSSAEKVGGPVRANSLIEGFRNAPLDCALQEVGLVGYSFTWSNNRKARIRFVIDWIEFSLIRRGQLFF